MTRHIRRGRAALAAALSLIIAAPGALWTLDALGQPLPAVEFRSPPSMEKAQEDTAHLAGPKVIIVDTPPATPASATSHGPYRILGAGFTGEVAYHQEFSIPEKGVVSDDPGVLRLSSLYVPIGDDLKGWALAGMNTGDGDSNTVVQQVFRQDSGNILRFTRIWRAYYPIDIMAPSKDGGPTLALDATVVHGFPAVILTRTSASPIPRPFTYLSFVDGAVETVIDAEGMDVAQAIELAERVISLASKEGSR